MRRINNVAHNDTLDFLPYQNCTIPRHALHMTLLHDYIKYNNITYLYQ